MTVTPLKRNSASDDSQLVKAVERQVSCCRQDDLIPKRFGVLIVFQSPVGSIRQPVMKRLEGTTVQGTVKASSPPHRSMAPLEGPAPSHVGTPPACLTRGGRWGRLLCLLSLSCSQATASPRLDPLSQRKHHLLLRGAVGSRRRVRRTLCSLAAGQRMFFPSPRSCEV